jgi:hypothetical protein
MTNKGGKTKFTNITGENDRILSHIFNEEGKR